MIRKVYRSVRLASVLLLMLLQTMTVMAQQHTVSGVVKDVAGTGMPGVNIIVKGSTNGTTSDMDGKFSLQTSSDDVLVISFIGYQTIEVPVGTQTTLSITLQEDVETLQEVVVVGYGVQDKKVVTGATVTVKTDDLVKTNSLRIEQALQGQTPGVQITSNSGQPGEGLKVRVRGAGTIGDADPLYIVDGVPIVDISYLNMASVERVDVLKDAASAAIYGARAANGVVLITTKKGASGKMQVSFDAYYGIQNAYKKLPMLNAREYMTIMNEVEVNSGGLPKYTQSQIDNAGKGTDWLDEGFNKNVPMQNYSLMLNGGNDKSTFATGLTYFKQEGIIGGGVAKSNYDRLTFTINSDHKAIKDIVKIGQNLTYTHSNKQGVRVSGLYYNSIRGFMNAPPIFPVYNEDGSFHSSTTLTGYVNPIAALYYQNFNKNFTDRIVGNVYTEVKPIKNLTFRSDFGIDMAFDGYHAFNPEFEYSATFYNTRSSATQSIYKNLTWNWDNTVRYNTTLSGVHNIEALVGTTARHKNTFGVGATAYGLSFGDYSFNHNILDNATDYEDLNQAQINGRISEYALLSYFGRLNYNYKEKYLLTAIVRRDASSNFGPNHKWGSFPSISAGWVLTEEDFLNNTIPWLNFLKFRAGWGQNGNDQIGEFKYLATVSSDYRDYYFGSGDMKYVGSSPNIIANPDLKWETSEQTNIGIEATIFRKINITADYYVKTTKDWLVTPPIPLIVGTGAPSINGGAVRNRGVELSASYNHKFGELSFGLSGNMAFNNNRVTRLSGLGQTFQGPANVLFQGMGEMYRAQVDRPIGYFYGLQVAGIFQNEDEVKSYTKDEKLIQPDAVPGDVKFVDANNDGVISDNDRVKLGSPIPDVTYGLTVNLGYKGFDFSVYTYGMGGQQVAMGVRDYGSFYSNYTTDILGRWHGEGSSNSQPRVTKNNEPNGNHKFSSLFVHDAGFYRIKTLNIGYDLKRLVKTQTFNQLRVYFSANNLFTFTKYKGLDPEVGFSPDGWSQGVDIGYYPQPRTYMLGLNVKL